MHFKQWFELQEALALAGDYKGSFFQRLVAAAYQISPISDPAAMAGYRDLARKIQRQQEFLQHRWEFVPSSQDHYRSMRHLRKEVEKQRAAGVKRARVYVYAEPPGPEGQSTEQGHPALTNDENITIRGVHDVIAHLAGGHPFSARGEYGAYNRHLKTLCNPDQLSAGECLAAKVLFTEIVGQTSYYYIYGNYPPQKAVILRDFDHINIGRLSSDSPLNTFFMYQVKNLVPIEDADWNHFYAMPIGAEFMRQEKVSKFVGLHKIPDTSSRPQPAMAQ